MSLTVSRILKQQFRRRSLARIWYGRVEHGLDVDVRVVAIIALALIFRARR